MEPSNSAEGATSNIDALWKEELAGKEGRTNWYAGGTQYWEKQDASIDGVLGGFAETHAPDLRESRQFLRLLQGSTKPVHLGTVLDCGAGIGRVTSGLLLQIFKVVDLLEPNERLLQKARESITDPRAERFIAAPLQEFQPDAQRYDVLWVQWVLLYLPDDDLEAFLVRSRRCLKPGGALCIKENVVLGSASFVVDKEDNSVSRTDDQMRAIFQKAGFVVQNAMRQSHWPDHLIPVMMYCLRPACHDS